MTSSPVLSISVVIPVYKNEDTIARAIASVRAQTAAPAEIVVVDDGGGDRSAEIAREAGAVVVSQANGGPGPARNTGIVTASQPWVAFLDADDVWLPEKLETQWAAHELRPDVRMSCTNFELVETGGRRPLLLDLEAYRGLSRDAIADGVNVAERGAVARRLLHGNFILPSTLMIARDLVVGSGVFALAKGDLIATPYCREAEDNEWCLRMLRSTDLLIVERPLTSYFRHGGNLSFDAGRERTGDVATGRRILGDPDRYPPGLHSEIELVRQPKLREAASEFFRHGKTSLARRALGEALSDRWTLRAAATLGVMIAIDHPPGRAALAGARTFWQRGLKPLLRRS